MSSSSSSSTSPISSPKPVQTTEVEVDQSSSAENFGGRVDPWKVILGENFSYEALTQNFGLSPIDEALIERIKRINPDVECNLLLLRKIFYAHQDLDALLKHVESGGEIYIYTGRGPSSDSLHLGHTLPLTFTAWLQKLFRCKVVVQMSDEEKYYFKDGAAAAATSLDDFMNYTDSNARDLIACGFDPQNTFIFSSLKYESHTRPIVALINKNLSVHVNKKVFGFEDSVNVGMMSWPPKQMAPAMAGSFPHLFGFGESSKKVMCLVPCAIDQAPYFRAIRESCRKAEYAPPALICCKFLPGLQGAGEKASSSGVIPAIFLNDTPNAVKTKINKFAFSGGGKDIEEHRKNGANLAVDIPYIYLCYLMKDDAQLASIAASYSSGRMLSGEIKSILIDTINDILAGIQSRRASISDEIMQSFFSIKVSLQHGPAYQAFRAKYIDIPIVLPKIELNNDFSQIESRLIESRLHFLSMNENE